MTPRELRSALLGVLLVLGMVAPLDVNSQATAVKAVAEEPFAAARFSITIDGDEIASFSELQQISSGHDVDLLELTSRGLKAPATRTPPTIVLKRGRTSNTELWEWHVDALVDPVAARKMAVLVMYDVEGRPVARYHLENAWPARYEIDSAKAGANEVLMETVTIVCEGITVSI